MTIDLQSEEAVKSNPRLIQWLVTLTALATAGCEANHYEIVLEPDGKEIKRELTCWRSRSANEETNVVAFPDDELNRIAVAYGAAIPSQTTAKHKFVSTFTGQMPKDVGGSGSYSQCSSPFGTVAAYVERFRGNDDLVAEIAGRQEATDRLADLLIGWLASELEGEAGFGELREFANGHFRRDLQNLSLYTFAYEVVADHDEEAAWQEYVVRISQFLVERSYFTPQQLPTLLRAMREADNEGSARLLEFVQQFIASKMGIGPNQPMPACLDFLTDEQTLQDSINTYLRQTAEFKNALEKWEQEKVTHPDAKMPEPDSILVAVSIRAFLPSFHLNPPDELVVKLDADTEPFLTNGQWDVGAGQVQWSDHMLEAGSDLTEFPTLLYALWSTPNNQEQTNRFGKVVLEGIELASYCLWYRGLSKVEANEWDKFIASLKPDGELMERIQAFRFSQQGSDGGEDEEGDLAATPRELILRGLTGEES